MINNKKINYDDPECLSYFSAINQIYYYIKTIEKQCRALYQKNQITEMANQNSSVIDSILMQRLGYYESMIKKRQWGTTKDALTFVDVVSREMCVDRVERTDSAFLEKLSRIHGGLERVCRARTRKNFKPSDHSREEDRAIFSDLSQAHQELNEIYQMDSKILEPYKREIADAKQKIRYREKRGRILSEMKKAAIIAGIGTTIMIIGVNVSKSIGEKNFERRIAEIEAERKEKDSHHLNFQMPSEDAVVQGDEEHQKASIRNHPYLNHLTYDKLKSNRGVMGKELYEEGLKMLAEEAVSGMSSEVISCLVDAAKEAAGDKNNTVADTGVIDFNREDKEIAIDCMKLFYEMSMNGYDSTKNSNMASLTFFLRYATRNLINYNTSCLYHKPLGSTGIYSKTLDKASFVWEKEKDVFEELDDTIYEGKERNTLEKFTMQSIKLAPLCRKDPMGVNGDTEYNNIVNSFLKGRQYSFETLLDLTSVIESTYHLNDTKALAKGESR